MIYLGIRITKPQEVSIRAHRNMTKAAHRVQGLYWHVNYLPKHFLPSAKTRYRYRRRTMKTTKRKQQLAARGKVQMGGTVDLVWTGRTRERLGEFATLREFPTRVTVRMVGPDYLRTNYRAHRPNLKGEITATVNEERKQLAKVFRDDYTARLAQYRKTRVQKVV